MVMSVCLFVCSSVCRLKRCGRVTADTKGVPHFPSLRKTPPAAAAERPPPPVKKTREIYACGGGLLVASINARHLFVVYH